MFVQRCTCQGRAPYGVFRKPDGCCDIKLLHTCHQGTDVILTLWFRADRAAFVSKKKSRNCRLTSCDTGSRGLFCMRAIHRDVLRLSLT